MRVGQPDSKIERHLHKLPKKKLKQKTEHLFNFFFQLFSYPSLVFVQTIFFPPVVCMFFFAIF